jgi:HK97 family phage prohead protease
MSNDEPGPVEIRSAAITDVSYPDRTIDLIAIPYDEWSPVEYQGRVIEESVAPGAFGAVINRARKFIVNLEHEDDRWLGSVLELRTADPKGLRSKIKIRRTPEGDQALNDAADGHLGASVGMAVSPSWQRWEGTNRRRIMKAFLHHLALTATPAYVGAKVLEVRTGPEVTPLPTSATPNLDRVLAELAADGYRTHLT